MKSRLILTTLATLVVLPSCLFAMAIPAIRWADDVTVEEKAAIMKCFSDHDRYSLYSGSIVARGTLNNDDTTEFFVNALAEGSDAEPQKSEVLLVVSVQEPQKADPCEVISEIETPGGGEGIRRLRDLYALDFDRDGDLDVVDQRQFAVTGEEASFFANVLHREGARLTPVYSAWSSGQIQFQDLDGDEQLELVETTNDFGIPYDVAYWKAVYEWSGTGFHEVSGDQFLDFYRERKAIYKTFLEESIEKNASFEENLGRSNPIALTTIRAMKSYLDRIRAIEGTARAN